MTASNQWNHLNWLDWLKALALGWIFLVHLTERLFGYPLFANPSAAWPPLAERLAQLQPLDDFGVWNLPINVLRYVGWAGDQGVQLFLITSGFGLTWGLLSRHGLTSMSAFDFYRRRALRLYPLWWGAHLLFAAIWLLSGWGFAPTSRAFFFSVLGIRLTPETLYYFAPAWWYVGLLLQLYLVFPLLWLGLQRWGPWKLFGWTALVAFALRAAGLVTLEGYLDAWSRGAIFITRLPEFVFGISLAAWVWRAPQVTRCWLTSSWTVGIALLVYTLGNILSLDLLGMTVAPFLTGVAVFFVLYRLLSSVPNSQILKPLTWIGQHSYSLFLLHHPFILLFIPEGLSAGAARLILGTAASIMATIIGAPALELIVDCVTKQLALWRKRGGWTNVMIRLGVTSLLVASVLLGAELAVRRWAPQEVWGWGERPSLVPDETLGWRLKPLTVTRLRWQSYDYTVSANALGFPGPEYSEVKAREALRLMVTGDAFSSAEGVDTSLAWPRLLERLLAERLRGRKVEVLNFAITGYGPNQYAKVIKTYAPVYQPDILVIQLFVNDYSDVLISDDEFRISIGFDQPDPEGWRGYVGLVHLRQYLRLQVFEPLAAWLRGRPNPTGYFLGNFTYLERERPDLWKNGRAQLTDRLQAIVNMAAQLNAQVILLMVPAPVQVCTPSQLDYYPVGVDVRDEKRYDLHLPQRITREIAGSLGVEFYDLQPVLRLAKTCPYQPHNMHWTVDGHQIVASYLTEVLVQRSMSAP